MTSRRSTKEVRWMCCVMLMLRKNLQTIQERGIMKRALPIMLLLVFIVTAAGTITFVQADAKTDQEIKDFLTQYEAAYEKKDLGALMKLIAPGAEVVFFEADEKGRYVGPDQIKAAYENSLKQIKSIKGEYKWTSVGSKGDVAWFATEVLFNVDTGEDKFKQLGRWTGVLEKKDGKWLLVQSHFSFPEQDGPPEK
jgi:ketosteroid isomerase-like protein